MSVEFALPTRSLHMVEPGDIEHPDTPANTGEGLDLGRRLGRELADLRGQPVVFGDLRELGL